MTDQTKALKLAQEPVAITAANHVAGEIGYCKFHMALPSGTNLYTSPPAQRKPLTDEEIGSDPIFRAGVRFAEAAHGIAGEQK